MKIITKIKSIIDKSVSYLLPLCKAMLPQRCPQKSAYILLVSWGGIGDAIMDASAWKALIEHYYDEGKKVFLIAPKEIWNIFKRVLNTKKFTFIETNCQNIYNVFSARKMMASVRKIQFDIIIARVHASFQLYMEIAATSARQRYAVLEQEMFQGWRKFTWKLLSKKYTNVTIEKANMSEGECIEHMLHNLGLTDYRMSIIPIPHHNNIRRMTEAYITLAVDSHNTRRRWGNNNFIELIKRLLEKFCDDIYITGNALQPEDIKQFSEAFKDVDRVKITVGRLSFEEWIELLRGAHFHIGVDSGSIHVAASVGTTAFCLAGVWGGYRFFPYQFAMNPPETKKPICVYRSDVNVNDLSCFGCAAKKQSGWGNDECFERCNSGLNNLCLEKITVNDVIHAIQKAKSENII